MKILYSLAFLFCLCAFQAKADFITYWKTGNPGVSADNQIIIPATGSNYYVYWIDVNDTGVSSEGLASGYHTLTFPYPGTFEVHILPFFGSFTRITFGPGSDAPKLIAITQWRDSQWANMENAFAGCTNLTITATYIPNTQNVISMAGMFSDCSQLTDVSGIDSWNISAVTNMQSMFANAPLFNSLIGNWNVSNVTNMSNMFLNAASFNQPVGLWEVGNVTNMSGMFRDAIIFDQPVNIARDRHIYRLPTAHFPCTHSQTS